MTLEENVTTDFKNDHNNLKPINKLSHVQGSSSPPLVHYTISNLLKKTVSMFGQRDAFIFPNHRLNYKEFDRMVDKLAIGFIKIGLKKGDRLGIWSPNRLEWVLTQFATARVGIILVNINPAYRLSELEYSLNKVGCKALILAKKFKSSEYLKMILSLVPELKISKKEKLQTKNLSKLNFVVLLDEVDDSYSGVWMFDEILNLGGDKERQKLTIVR